MRKRVLGLTMAMVTAISMTGCGGGSTAATTAAAKEDATTAAAASEGESKDAAAASSDWGQYDLKLATNLAEDHVACKGYYAFADAV